MKLKNLTHEEFLMQLNAMEACSRWIKYIKKNKYDLKTFWENSCHYFYLYWYAGRIGTDMRQIVLSAVKIARLNKLSEQSENVLAVCEKWANGDDSITYEELRNAALALNAESIAATAACWAAYRSAEASTSACLAVDVSNAAFPDKKQEIIRGLIEIWSAEAVANAGWTAESAAVAFPDKKQEILEIIRGLIEIESSQKPEFKCMCYGYDHYYCGNCRQDNIQDYKKEGHGYRMRFCPDCGVKIDWGIPEVEP